MEVVLIIFVFFILHFQFLLEYLFSGQTKHVFFGWELEYNYSHEVALAALLYTLYCLFALLAGYYIGRRRKKMLHQNQSNIGDSIFHTAEFLLMFQLFCFVYTIVKGGFSYGGMVETRESINFLFELRMIPTLLFSYILFNSELEDWKTRKYRKLLVLLILYFISICFIQARSLLFELLGVISIYLLRVKHIRVRLRYLFYLYVVSILPNVMVLFRLSESQSDFSNIDTYKNLFTYEYSLLFNNILSEVMNSTTNFLYGATLSNAFSLLIPSFLRGVFSTDINKDLMTDIAHDAGVFGGGFSLLAELYLNFGYFSIILFLLVGYFLGKAFYLIYNDSSISLFTAATPIFYVWFILAFRNDLAVIIKQIVQLSLIVFTFKILIFNSRKINV